jgi:hypothetical protein
MYDESLQFNLDNPKKDIPDDGKLLVDYGLKDEDKLYMAKVVGGGDDYSDFD